MHNFLNSANIHTLFLNNTRKDAPPKAEFPPISEKDIKDLIKRSCLIKIN